jgi:hypothetical protein
VGGGLWDSSTPALIDLEGEFPEEDLGGWSEWEGSRALSTQDVVMEDEEPFADPRYPRLEEFPAQHRCWSRLRRR